MGSYAGNAQTPKGVKNMPSKVFGVKYPKIGDRRKFGGKEFIAVITTGSMDDALSVEMKYPSTPTKITGKKVGGSTFITVWVKR